MLRNLKNFSLQWTH